MFGRLTLSFSLTFYSNVVEIKSSQVDFCGENQSKKFSSSLFIFYFDFFIEILWISKSFEFDFCGGYQNFQVLEPKNPR